MPVDQLTTEHAAAVHVPSLSQMTNLLACAAATSANVLNLIWACADESSNADDMVDILELVPDTIRAAINAHLDSMNSLYPIRSVAASLHALKGGITIPRQSAGGLLAVHAKLLAAANNVLSKASS